MKEKRFNILYLTAFCIYINYFIHGIGVSILAQNTNFLQAQWNTNHSTILYIISAMGIGRFVVLPISGAISDKFGRRVTILSGMILYALFFALIYNAPNAKVAFFIAILGGVANSFFDTGCIPAVLEILSASTGFASILTKLFISIGQYMLPIFVGYLAGNHLNYGYSFLLCVALLIINGIALMFLPFPKSEVAKPKDETSVDEKNTKANFFKDGLAIILIGFTSTATFQIFLNVNKAYAMTVLGMTESMAGKIQSYYALGSILAVLITAVLVKKWIKPVNFLFIYPLISAITLFTIFITKSEVICIAGGFIIGFTAAGGVLQLTVATMIDLFQGSKGKMTSLVMLSSSIATFSTTAMAGVITNNFGIEYTPLFAGMITMIGVLVAIFVNIRYYKLNK